MSDMPRQPGSPPPDGGDLLDAYLDGGLEPPQRAAFEGSLREESEQAAQVHMQKAIDASLARLFGGGAGTEAAGVVPAPIPIAAARHRTWRLLAPLAAAAAMALMALAGYVLWTRGPLSRIPDPKTVATVDRLGPLYKLQLARDFMPDRVCTTRQEFAKWVKDYYGQPLYPNTDGAGIELVGWAYGTAVSPGSGVLLARVDGKEVIVAMDKAKEEKELLPPPSDPGLHSYRQRLGSLVLYEVSPLDHPAILPRLSLKQ